MDTDLHLLHHFTEDLMRLWVSYVVLMVTKILSFIKEISLANLHEDICDRENCKGHIDLQIIGMITNGKNNQEQLVRYYISKDPKK